MGQKPPAFQFYAKDWRSSMNVQRMTREQRSIFIDMMAIAWDSESPGTITLSDAELCRELRILRRSLRRLLSAFPACWRREDGMLVQPKLREQWLKYQEISTKRSAIAQQMHMQKGESAFASAPAPAKSNTTPLPPAGAGAIKFLSWMGQTIEVQMGRHRRMPSLEAYHGSMAYVVAAALTGKGYPARVVMEQ